MTSSARTETATEGVRTALPGEVFAKELETIVARREAAGLDAQAPLAVEGIEPSPERGLVGIAMSGGGIRSSTLSLGVIQALAREGVFKHVDYMSTVSGGGYTGSMISSLLNDPERAHEEFPLAKPDGQEEPAPLQHLRNGSNYLSPGGLLETIRLPSVVARGLLLNILLFLPWVMLAVLVTEFVHERGHDLRWHLSQVWPSLARLLSDNSAILLLAPVLALIYVFLTGIRRTSWDRNNRYELNMTRAFVVLGCLVVAFPLVHLVDLAIQTPYHGDDGLEGIVRRHFSFGVWAAALGFFAVGFAILKASEQLSRVRNRIVLLAAAIAGPGILFCIYLLMCVAQVDSPFIPLYDDFAEPAQPPADTHVTETPLRLSAEVTKVLRGKGIDYGPDEVTLQASFCHRRRAWHIPKPGNDDPDLTGICDAPDDDIESKTDGFRLALLYDDIEIIGARLRLGGLPSNQTLLPDTAFAVLALVLFVLNLLFLDINRASLHSFYRDRLSRLYLFRRRKDGDLEPNDAQTLSDLNRPGTQAPYHLLNAALNLQGSTVASQRGRKADFFVFSKHYCGGPHTGYCETRALEKWDPRANLGTAMAISAAAASPNMGAVTIRPVVFVMTLLNLRLGYWIPNPIRVRTQEKMPGLWRRRPQGRYLFREALGSLDAKHPLVNVSDGGHLENLGIYELLRRKCKLIIALDGEADPSMSFGSLVTLMRYAKIDLGVDIDIDLDAIRLDESGHSRSHVALGTILYGYEGTKRRRGHLLYVKSSLTGDEDAFLLKYRADHPAYPHETTADQFFDEAQFEAYRALGEHMGEGLLRDEGVAKLPAFSAVLG